jgi:hypothetical protein
MYFINVLNMVLKQKRNTYKSGNEELKNKGKCVFIEIQRFET